MNGSGKLKRIKLTRGKWAIVDECDFEVLSKYKWYAVVYRGFYWRATRYVKDNKYKYMQHHLMPVKKGFVVDHINGNPLDNRRKNIRYCTKRQNVQNRTHHRKHSSKYKGVSWSVRDEVWRSEISSPRRKSTNIGSFKSEIKAAKAYDKEALKYFGEFAFTNFPRSNYATSKS